MEESQEKELRRIQRKRIQRIIIASITILVFGAMAFTYFHITTEARLSLREGKNVKLALDMLDIEYFGKNKSVYNPNRSDGMESGVEQQVYDIVGQTGEIEILSYDRTERKILYMLYEDDNYRVIYKYDTTNGDQWKVDYLVTIFDYSD